MNQRTTVTIGTNMTDIDVCSLLKGYSRPMSAAGSVCWFSKSLINKLIFDVTIERNDILILRQ